MHGLQGIFPSEPHKKKPVNLEERGRGIALIY